MVDKAAGKQVGVTRDTSGAVAVEYGLIAALIVVAILAALNNFGDANDQQFNQIETAITTATGS